MTFAPHPIDPLLDAVLEEAAFSGWAEGLFAKAGAGRALEPAAFAARFPGGVDDALVAFADWADEAMIATLAGEDLGAMKIRARVTLAVRARFEALGTYKTAARRAAAALALPHRAGFGARLLWRTSDRVWRALRDPSADFNYYSKRAILCGVIGSTFAAWASADDPQIAWDFLDRRIENVMQFETLKRQAKPLERAAEEAVAFLGGLRHGRRG